MTPTSTEKPKFFIGSTGRAYVYVEALVAACQKLENKTEREERFGEDQFKDGYPLDPRPWQAVFKDPRRTDPIVA